MQPPTHVRQIAWMVGLVMLLAAGHAWSMGSRVPVVGTTAFDFTLTDLNGQPHSLSQYRGQIVLLNFWATWCKPCEDEMPSMEQLSRRMQGREFELVAISVDEDVEQVRSFQERLGLSFPILLDPAQEASRRYQTTGYPESFLIDRDGLIASQRFVGPRDWSDPAYVALVERLVARGGP